MHIKLNNKPFVIEHIDAIHTNDYPDFCDAYIEEASVFENDEWRDATEAEIDQANDLFTSEINEMIHSEQLYL
jgi:hypothetical protein